MEIEHNRYEGIDNIRGGESAAHEERPEHETSDWHHGTAHDVECQKAFDNIVDELASVPVSDNGSAVRGNSFVGNLDVIMLELRCGARQRLEIMELAMVTLFFLCTSLCTYSLVFHWFWWECCLGNSTVQLLRHIV